MKTLLNTVIMFFVLVNFSHGQWQQLAQLTGVSVVPRISVVDSNVVWVLGSQIIYRSVNGGLNWESIPVVFPVTHAVPILLTAIAAKDSLTAFVGDGDGSFSGGNAKFFKTTNAGQNWILIDSTGGNSGFFNDIQFSKSITQFGIALSDPHNGLGGPFNLWKTTNGGLTWIRTYPPGRQGCYGFYYASFVIDFQFYGFIVVSPLSLIQYPFITSSGGNAWYYGNDSMEVSNSGDIAFNDNKLNGIMNSGSEMPVIKITADGGYNWSNVNTGVPGGVFSGACFVSGSNVAFIWGTGSTAGDIIRSDDNGANWTVQNTSSISGIVEIDYATFGNRLIGYAVNQNGTVLKSRQTLTPIGIYPISNELPSRFHIFQNYPNPFNPVTKIKFEAPLSPPEKGMQIVSLKIYDILGREVSSLFSSPWGRIGGATYEVEWDASNYSSGVYYYRLTAGDYSETRKMIFIK